MNFLQYYAIDWLAMVLTFWAIWQIGDKRKMGFITMIFGNACWILVGYLTASAGLVIANMLFIAMNLRAIIKWSKSKPERTDKK